MDIALGPHPKNSEALLIPFQVLSLYSIIGFQTIALVSFSDADDR